MNKFWLKVLYCWTVINVCSSFTHLYFKLIESGTPDVFPLIYSAFITCLISCMISCFIGGFVYHITFVNIWED